MIQHLRQLGNFDQTNPLWIYHSIKQRSKDSRLLRYELFENFPHGIDIAMRSRRNALQPPQARHERFVSVGFAVDFSPTKIDQHRRLVPDENVLNANITMKNRG